MSESPERTIERLEEQLERAEQTLQSLRLLNAEQARRVAKRMDRLHSQLLAVSEPPSLEWARKRLGTEPAGADEFAQVAEKMGPSDGEG